MSFYGLSALIIIIDLYLLYLLVPQGHPLSGTAQKGEKEAAKRGFNWRIVIIITIRPVPVLLAHPLILEFLPPSAERLLYHGYIIAVFGGSGSAVALKIGRGRALRGLFLCNP